MASVTGTIAAVGKVLTAVVGLALVILNSVVPLVPDADKLWVNVAIAVCTAVAGYFAPYAPLGGVRRSVKRSGRRKARSSTVGGAHPHVGDAPTDPKA